MTPVLARSVGMDARRGPSVGGARGDEAGCEAVLWRERMGVEPTEDASNAPQRI